MATILLIRHGRTTANASGVLAGRSAGVHLDDAGRAQAVRAGERLAAVPLARLVSSPLERCRETSAAIAAHQQVPVTIDEALTECDYGSWQGRPLSELAQEPLWTTVQTQPAAVTFPGGESMIQMQTRAVTAVRRIDAEVTAEHGPHAVWAVASHGDVIKSVLADALGLHLDLFQRLHVDPASVSIVRHGDRRPDVVAVNTTAGDLGWLAARDGSQAPGGDAAVGGGAGQAPADPPSMES